MTVTADHEPGLRERKKLETRQRLRAVALRLATERGVEHVTVEDIAAEADVSTRTFFNYFATKEDALIGPDPSSASDLARALADRPTAEEPLESLRQLMLMRAATIEERVDDMRARMHLVTHCAALQPGYLATASAFDRILTEGIAARLGTDPDLDLYPALLAAVGSTAMRTTIVTWLNGPGGRPLTQMLDEAFDQIAAGLPPPGRPGVAPAIRPARSAGTPARRRTHR
jgi:AcrR family transcriptional regulator